MNSAISPLTRRATWAALLVHHEGIAPLRRSKLFVDGRARGKRLARAAVGICLEYSKQRISTSP
jgi:hypothetical protein